jgi:hypothetical protein
MGGSGSGSYYHWWRRAKKTVVEDCLSLDANRWMRAGILRAGIQRAGSWEWTYTRGRRCSISYEVLTQDMETARLRLTYSRRRAGAEEKESVDYHVRLATTRPRFGGLRWWFNCPLLADGWVCNRRVGKLYLPPRGRYFGCRHCHDLTYTSCQESHKYDSLYRHMAASTGYDFATVKDVMGRLGKDRL